jgi:hypothetical protein
MAKEKKTAKKRTPRKPPEAVDSQGSKAKARERATIERVLSIGAAAKVKLYHSYLTRISQGKNLKPSEVKFFRQLESELNVEAGNDGGNRGNVFASMDDAAKYVGTSKKTISYHIKKGKLRQNTDGTFERAELDRWLSAYGRKGGTSAEVETIRQQQEKAELRYRLARARREELLTAQIEKTMVEWGEVEQEWAARIREVGSGLEAFADRLPALLVGRSRDEIYHVLQTETRELRDRYARDGRYCPEVNNAT